MALTPVEIRHMKPEHGLHRLQPRDDRPALDEIAASFEDVWRERADLADKVEQLEADLVRFRELETLLRTTLVSAERASAELKEQARREADLILGEAHAEARERPARRDRRERAPGRRVAPAAGAARARRSRRSTTSRTRRRRPARRTTARTPGRASAKPHSSTYTGAHGGDVNPPSPARQSRRGPRGDRRPARRRLEGARHRGARARPRERGGAAAARGGALRCRARR